MDLHRLFQIYCLGNAPMAELDAEDLEQLKAHRIFNIAAKKHIDAECIHLFPQAPEIYELGVLRELAFQKKAHIFLKEICQNKPRAFPLKAFYLMEHGIYELGLRQFGDIDYFIEPSELNSVVPQLLKRGFHLDSNKGSYNVQIEHCFKGRDALNLYWGDIQLELHTHILPFHKTMGKEESFDLQDPNVHLLHLLINASKHHFSMGLSFVFDLYLFEQKFQNEISWNSINQWTARYDLSAYVKPSLMVARTFHPDLCRGVKMSASSWLSKQYTKYVIRTFAQAPKTAPVLKGSPLIFILAGKNSVRTLLKHAMVLPKKKEKDPGIQNAFLRLRRMVELLFRHGKTSVYVFWKILFSGRD